MIIKMRSGKYFSVYRYYIGNNKLGYIGAAYDITDYISYARNIIVVVRVDATQYDGCSV